jgi:hypothetical protein
MYKGSSVDVISLLAILNITTTDTKVNYVYLAMGVVKKYQNPKGGLNAAGRAHFKNTTGANLKPPAPNPKTPKDAARRKSFCARMEGMKKVNTSAKTARDPNSRINKSLRAWDC